MNLLLFTKDALIVKGYSRTCIYDLTRNKYYFAPTDIGEFIAEIDGKDRDALNLSSEKDKWIDMFISNELLLEIPEPTYNNFKNITNNKYRPYFIDYCCIDFENLKKLKDIFEFLQQFGCSHILLKLYDLQADIISSIDNMLFLYEFTSVSLLIENRTLNDNTDYNTYTNFIEITYQSDLSEDSQYYEPILLLEKDVVNVSIHSNTYYYRKIFINNLGRIKIHDSDMDIKFSIDSSTYEIEKYFNYINNHFWKTNKDKIDICRDCEFRYMCIDSRIPKQRVDNTWYYETECDYNPYISKWKGEGGYINLEETGVMCNDILFKLDENLIKAHQERLWSD